MENKKLNRVKKNVTFSPKILAKAIIFAKKLSISFSTYNEKALDKYNKSNEKELN